MLENRFALHGNTTLDFMRLVKSLQINGVRLDDNSVDGVHKGWEIISREQGAENDFMSITKENILLFMSKWSGREEDTLTVVDAIESEDEFSMDDEGMVTFN